MRAADEATVIVADGFSCRSQIRSGTARAPLHLAQVIARAAIDAPASAPGAGDTQAPA